MAEEISATKSSELPARSGLLSSCCSMAALVSSSKGGESDDKMASSVSIAGTFTDIFSAVENSSFSGKATLVGFLGARDCLVSSGLLVTGEGSLLEKRSFNDIGPAPGLENRGGGALATPVSSPFELVGASSAEIGAKPSMVPLGDCLGTFGERDRVRGGAMGGGAALDPLSSNFRARSVIFPDLVSSSFSLRICSRTGRLSSSILMNFTPIPAGESLAFSVSRLQTTLPTP